MVVSENYRDHMRRIGAAKAASHAEATAAHRARPLAERLRRSWELYLRGRATAHVFDEEPVAFYERARALGLYRP